VPPGVVSSGEINEIPAVAVVTANDLKIALHLSPGKCAVVAQSGTDRAIAMGSDAPGAGKDAQEAPRELPSRLIAAGPQSFVSAALR
jgi:hypothetical protein